MKTNFFRMKLLGLFEEWCKLADADRRRNFLHNSLWVGLLPAAAVGFGVTFLIGLAGGEDSLERILRYACLSGGLNAFSWTTGIWAAVGPDEPDTDVEQVNKLPQWARILIGAGGVLLLLALIGYPDWQRWYDGERSLTLTIAALVTKISCIFCVALPIALQLRKR